MSWLGLLIGSAACAARHPVAPPGVGDEELQGPPGTRTGEAATAPVDDPTTMPRAEAPRGKGLRTGTIARARLLAVLDLGLGNFLRQVELAPRQAGQRFVGWQLVQLLDASGPLHDLDVAPGDVLLSINGQPLARPEQAQAMWDSLRTANEVRAKLWRGETKLELRFAIDPPVTLQSGG